LMKLGRAEYVPLTGIRCCYITCARPCVAPQYQAPRNPLRARTPPLQLRIDSDHLPTGQPPTKIQIHRYKDNLMQSLIVSTILPSLCTVHPLTPPGRATLRTVLAHNIAKIESPATSTPKGRGWVYVCLLPGKHTKAPALAPGSNPRGVARTDFLAHHPRPGVTCHRHPSLLPQGHQPLMGNHT